MGKFLLGSGRLGFVDAQAIGIVSQIKDGDNPASLIMAKPFYDWILYFKVESHKTFLGVPWLCKYGWWKDWTW